MSHSQNGSPKERARVVAKITNLGPEFGFGEVVEVLKETPDYQPQPGQGIFLLGKVCEVLTSDREGSWESGSLVVLEVHQNLNEDHRDRTPWAAVYAHTRDRKSRRAAKPGPQDKALAVVAGRADALVADIREVSEAWAEVDPGRADAEARKAAEDIKVAMRGRDLQAARSALGRLRVRVEELLAPALLGKELETRADEVAKILGL